MTREVPIKPVGHEFEFGTNQEGTISYRYVEIKPK
jgi:hypothetical protein